MLSRQLSRRPDRLESRLRNQALVGLGRPKLSWMPRLALALTKNRPLCLMLGRTPCLLQSPARNWTMSRLLLLVSDSTLIWPRT